MKIVCTIEARMTSKRLPGKVLLNAAGKPLLLHLIERLQRVPSIDEIVLATTTNKTDDILEDFAYKNNLLCFRGDEEDVMLRVIGAADYAKADIVVEITGDCPIIDPSIIQQTIDLFKINPCDYATNAHVRCYPDGMDTQVFPLNILQKSYSMTDNKLDREHVTLHIRNNPSIFKHVHLPAPMELYWPSLGLTLDEEGDYLLLKKIIEHFYENNHPFFSCHEVISLLKKQESWLKLNSEVLRKDNT